MRKKWKCWIAMLLVVTNLCSTIVSAAPTQIQSTETIEQENRLCIGMKEQGELECVLELGVGANTTSAGRVNAYKKDETYYLLLPAQVDLTAITVAFENTMDAVALWDGQTISEFTPKNVTTGKHSITIGGIEHFIVVMQSAQMASMFLTTEELDKIHADRDYKTKGTMTLMSAEGSIAYDGDLAQLKTRGNSSFYNDKKPYQIKLDHAEELLGMGKAKTWILLANANDQSAIRHKTIYDLAKKVGLPYSVSGEWVDLYINGDYFGTYLLSEKVEIDENRVNITDLEKMTEAVNPGAELDAFSVFNKSFQKTGSIKGVSIPNDPQDITGGYLLEFESSYRYGKEPSGFITDRNQAVVIKSPEYASEAQAEYIADVFQQFEDAICSEDGRNPVTNKRYSEYFDMTSFVKRYIIEEVSRNVDSGITSCFFYKQAGEDELVYSGPCWDYDTSLGRNWGIANKPEGLGYSKFTDEFSVNWFEELYKFAAYRNQIRVIYNQSIRPALEEIMEETIPNYIKHLDASLAMNEIRWPDEDYGITYQQDQKKVSDFLKNRVAWLDKTWTLQLEEDPEMMPTMPPTAMPTESPTMPPTAMPTESPTEQPTPEATLPPTAVPTPTPTMMPTPTATPTSAPTSTSPSIPPEVKEEDLYIAYNENKVDFISLHSGATAEISVLLSKEYGLQLDSVEWEIKDNESAEILNEKGQSTSIIGKRAGRTEITATIIIGQTKLQRKLDVTVSDGINKCVISKIPNYYFTGNAISPKVTVLYYGKKLVEGRDYCISYENNQKVGKANIRIAGKGVFTGGKVLTFEIQQKKKQSISGTSSFLKQMGQASFFLNASAKTALTYKSSNGNVAKVDAKGKVTITGIGTVTITVYAKENGEYMASSKTIKITVKPKAVQKLAVSKRTDASISLSWKQDKTVDGYKVYRYDAKKKAYVMIKTIKGNKNSSFVDTKRSAGSVYRYYVAAYKGSYISNPVIMETYTLTRKGTINKCQSISKNTVKITWKKDSSAKGYEIYVATNKKGKYKKVSSIGKNSTISYTHKKLKSKTTYYYKIRSYKVVQMNGKKVSIYGDYSEIKSVKVK